MQDRDPNIVSSSHSGPYRQGDILLEVNIFRLEHERAWSLEVVNQRGTSTVFDDQFESDDLAYHAFLSVLEEEGVEAFLESGNVVPFPGSRS